MSALPAALAFAAAALGVAGIGALAGPALARLPRPRRGASRPGRAPGAAGLRLLAAVGGGLRPVAAPGDLAARVVAAGRPGGLGARELMAAKVAAGVAGAAAGPLVGAVLPGRLGVLAVAAAPVAGFLAPDAWLLRRARERARLVRRALPGQLDLLSVTVAAGSSLPAALAAVGARTGGPLAREWRVAAREVELGVPLSESLAGLAARLPLPEVAALVRALERAGRHGTPPADTLAAQARHARLAERRRVQEAAARAGPKIQLVVALLLVPSVLLLVAAALAAALLGGGGLPLG